MSNGTWRPGHKKGWVTCPASEWVEKVHYLGLSTDRRRHVLHNRCLLQKTWRRCHQRRGDGGGPGRMIGAFGSCSSWAIVLPYTAVVSTAFDGKLEQLRDVPKRSHCGYHHHHRCKYYFYTQICYVERFRLKKYALYYKISATKSMLTTSNWPRMHIGGAHSKARFIIVVSYGEISLEDNDNVNVTFFAPLQFLADHGTCQHNNC